MEQHQTLPEAAKLVMPKVIPFFNLDEREEILKRRRSEKLSKGEALQINSIRLTRRIAKAALKFYNEKQGGNYELVDENAETSNAFIYWSLLKYFLHASFRAKKADDGSANIKLFFAETTLKKDGVGMDVLNCCIIEENDATKFTRGCLYCWEDIIHPHADKYWYGNTMRLNGCRVTIDFNKVSIEEVIELQQSKDSSEWSGIDGLSIDG